MDAAPTTFANLPLDPELGLPVPFACGTDDPYGAPASGPSARTLDKRRVTPCALSRICGVFGTGLGRPIAFGSSPFALLSVTTSRSTPRSSFAFWIVALIEERSLPASRPALVAAAAT